MGYWDRVDVGDPRIADGFAHLRARRRRDLDDGAGHIGWKVGMNDGGVREMLGIRSGVVGYLTDRTLSDGDGVVAPGSGRLGAEVEVAFVIGDDGGIASARAAIEIVDLHELDIVDALSRDVWHHAFTLGSLVAWSADMLGALSVALEHNGTSVEVAPPGTDRLADLDGMLAFVADGVEAVGERLRPGDLILSGSLAPSIVWLQPGDEVRAAVAPLGTTSARIARA